MFQFLIVNPSECKAESWKAEKLKYSEHWTIGLALAIGNFGYRQLQPLPSPCTDLHIKMLLVGHLSWTIFDSSEKTFGGMWFICAECKFNQYEHGCCALVMRSENRVLFTIFCFQDSNREITAQRIDQELGDQCPADSKQPSRYTR